MTLPVHPLADLFPLIEGEAFDALVKDIAANGLREKIVIWKGAILDGRNRFRALVAAGLINERMAADAILAKHPGFFRRIDLPVGKLPGLVISLNLNRRHLTESQRAMVAAKLSGGSRPAANLPDAAPAPVVKVSAAAQMLAVSERSVRDARAVASLPAAAKAVQAGALAVSDAAGTVRAARAEGGADEAAVAAAYARLRDELERAKADAKAAKAARRDERLEALASRIEAGNAALAHTDRRYGVILADPEWTFETWGAGGKDRAAENHYPCSSLDAIKTRVPPAAADCVLLLWVTVPMLKAGLEVLEVWGFEYRSHLIWDKRIAGTGYWLRNRHELLLIGVRGAVVPPEMGTQFVSLFSQQRGAHSAKPSIAHEMAERHWPGLPKLEMNARAARPGWDVWGAEAPEGGA